MEKSSTNETMVLTIKNLSKSKWSSLSKKKIEEKSCYSPRTEKLIDIISPILDYYGYNKEDVYNFISLYKFDIEKIQLELCNIMESREENNEGLWETVKSKKNKKPVEKNSKNNNSLQGTSGRKDNKQIGKIFPKGLRLKEKDPRRNKTIITDSSFAVGQYSNKPFTSSNHKATHIVSNRAKCENSSTLHEINKKIPEERGSKEKQDVDKSTRKLVNIKSLSTVAASATASATTTTAATAAATAAARAADDGANRDAAEKSKEGIKKKGTLKSEEEKRKGLNESYDEDFMNNNSPEERDTNKRKKNAIKEPGGVVNEEHFAKGREDNSNKKGKKSGYNNVGSSSVSNPNINSHYNQFDKKKYVKLEDGKAPPAAASTATGGGYKSIDEHRIKKDSKGKGAIIIPSTDTGTTTTNSGSGNQDPANVGTNGLGTTTMATSANRYSNFNCHDKYFNKNYNRYSGKPLNDSLIPRNEKQRFPPFSNKSTDVYNSGGNHSYLNSYTKGGLKPPPYLSKNSLRSKRNTSKNNSIDHDYDAYSGEKLADDTGNNNDQSSSIHNENDLNVMKKVATETAKKTGNDKTTASTSYASVVNSKMKQSSLASPLEEAKNVEVKRTGTMNTQIISNDSTFVKEEKKEKKKNKCQLIPIKNNQPEKLWVSVITKGSVSTSSNPANSQDVGEKVDPSGTKKNALSSSKELKPESTSQQVIKKTSDQSGKPEKQKKKGKGKEKDKEKEIESISNNVCPSGIAAKDTNLSSSNNSGYKNKDHLSKVRSKGENQPDGEEPLHSKGTQLSYGKDGKNEPMPSMRNNNKSSFVEVEANRAQPFVDQHTKTEKEKYTNEMNNVSNKEPTSAKKISETKLDTDDKKKKKKKSNDQDVISAPINDSKISTRVKTASDSPVHEMKRGRGSKVSSNNNRSLNLTYSTEKLVSDDFTQSKGYDGKEKTSIPIYMPNLALMGNNTMNKKIFFGSINITGNQIEDIHMMPDSKLEHIRNNRGGNGSGNNGHSGAYGEPSGRFGTHAGGFHNQGSTSYNHGLSSYNTQGSNYNSGAYNNSSNNNSSNKMVHTENRKKNNLRKNYSIDSASMGINNDHLGSGNHNRSSAMHHKENDNRDYDHNNNDFRGSKEREFKHFDFKSRNHKREDNNEILNENKHKSIFSSSNSKHAPHHVHTKSQNLYLPKMTTTTSSSSAAVAAGTTAMSSSSSNNHHHHIHNNSGNVNVNNGNQNAKDILNSSSSVFMNQSPRTNGSQENSSALMSGNGTKYVQSALNSKNYDSDGDDSGSIQLNKISQKFLHGGVGTAGANGSGNTNGNSGNSDGNGLNGVNDGNGGNSNNLANSSIIANIGASNTGATSMSNKNTNTDVSNISLMNMGMNNLSNNNMYNSYNSPPGLANQFNYSFTNLSYPYNNMHYNGYSTQTLLPQYGLINNHYTKNNSMHNNNFNYNMNYDNFDESNLYAHNNNMHMNNYVNYMNVNVKKNQGNNLDDDNLSNSGEVSISGSLQQPQNPAHENQNSSNQNAPNVNNNSNNNGNANSSSNNNSNNNSNKNSNSNGGSNVCLDGTTNNGINNLSLNNINMNSSVNPNLTMSCATSATSELKNKQQISKNMSDMQLQQQSISSLKQNQIQQSKTGSSLNTTQQQHTSNQHSQSKHTGQQNQQNLLNNNNNSSINQYTQNQISPNNSQNTASSTSSSLTRKVETNNLNVATQNNQNNQNHFLNKQLYHNSSYYNVNSNNNYNIPPGFNMTQEKEQNNNYLGNNVSSTNANTSVAAYRNNWNNINEKNLNHYSLNYNYNRSTKNNFNYTSNLNYNSSNGYNGTRDNTNNFFNYNSFNYGLQTPPGLQNYYQNTQYQQQNSYSNRNYNYTGYNNNLSMWSK
ncbi:hypothetical protein C922_05107 [Plasmodium inui San Antonio 1]|uniref:Uncharacterized protein n=1 Tax=Plasmodium inui San Antonio 1 TaxID=1237626 RepID=W6ZZ12_9APIC|nr:hypothetical protein C922_05107 [Plasmodium inui San Antonio 1]EUD64500.1 hypothetical protein C922_05107 [Plasmodium inui San Antonio 1]